MSVRAPGSLPSVSVPSTPVRTLRAHTAPVQVARFTSSRAYAVTGGQDRLVCLWAPFRAAYASHPETGGALLSTFHGHGSDVRDVVASDDSTRLASAGGDRCAFLWDVATGAAVRRVFGHDARVNACALSAGGGALLATASDDMTEIGRAHV